MTKKRKTGNTRPNCVVLQATTKRLLRECAPGDEHSVSSNFPRISIKKTATRLA